MQLKKPHREAELEKAEQEEMAAREANVRSVAAGAIEEATPATTTTPDSLNIQDFIEEETPVVVRNTPVSISSNRYSTHGKPSGNENVPSSDKIAEMKFVEILNKERKKSIPNIITE